ncbi:monooxygenase, partial [Mycobacterium tuberculosis]
GRKRARRTGATRSEGTEEANAREGAEGRRRRHRQGGGQDRGRRANSEDGDKNGDGPGRPTTTGEADGRSRRGDRGDDRSSS